MPRPRTSRPHPLGSPRRASNPKATPAEHRRVRRLAHELVKKLDPGGTAAVLLAGSWARGDAHTASDIDLWVIRGRGRERETHFERDGRLVAVKYGTNASARQAMRDPARFPGAVSGWRVARVVQDPTGAATRLKREAAEFRWSRVRRARDRYVADQLAGWAEEVVKLLRAMETGERATASVQRNLLANRMAYLRALELEVRPDTDNGLWERTARRAGAAFHDAQRAALGTDGAGWRESCEGALRLYAITARASLPLLRGENRRIVRAACQWAGYPLEKRGSKGR